MLLVGAGVHPQGGWTGTENQVERGVAEYARHAVALVYERDGAPGLGCAFVRGSALELPFADNTFDYVVSNAVIEHVGGRGAAAKMVAESRRVARRFAFHTTPYRWFPIETHTQVPLLHWLPRQTQAAIFARIGKPHFNGRDYYLFGVRSMRSLGHGGAVEHAGSITLIGSWPAT